MQARDKKAASVLKDDGFSDGRLDFSQHLLKCTSQGGATIDFLADTLKNVLKVSRCDAVELWLKEGVEIFCEATAAGDGDCSFRIVPEKSRGGRRSVSSLRGTLLDLIGRIEPSGLAGDPFCTCTRNRSVWIHDVLKPVPGGEGHPLHPLMEDLRAHKGYRSLILLPLRFGTLQIGCLICKQKKRTSCEKERIEYLETVSAKFELALLHHLSQAKLKERVKELSCLYGIAQIRSDRELSFEQKLARIVELLPEAWQYPADACARIVADGVSVQTPGFRDGKRMLRSPIRTAGKERGYVAVHYPDDRSFLQANPFLEEERNLIANIAGQISDMIELMETEKANAGLQSRLIHADRLAAIGQLAAGVAHELNEPLNTILGFAQLVQKNPDLPSCACKDLEKITEASLHARKIIRELLIFARQTPPCRSRFSLNRVIEEELSLFEAMCAKSGVEFRRSLAPRLPEITADKAQMLQVLTNLVVNALQAMPQGGLLTIRTLCSDRKTISLMVEDTGIGMSEEVKNNIFVPFFTTKDIGQGTGLGLAVVHGIITSHRGLIQVESAPGEGTRFTITLPCTPSETRKKRTTHDTLP
ncbi:MAG TPA: ATP-binding protein [Deltaproteobacteria bacterium]|jgi:signal transduction histidine kinase|nr:ATP-binding protein [Deltaproteobacteria bacterium]